MPNSNYDYPAKPKKKKIRVKKAKVKPTAKTKKRSIFEELDKEVKKFEAPKKTAADSSRSKTVRVSGILTGKSAASDTLAKKDLTKLLSKETLTAADEQGILKNTRARMDIRRNEFKKRQMTQAKRANLSPKDFAKWQASENRFPQRWLSQKEIDAKKAKKNAAKKAKKP